MFTKEVEGMMPIQRFEQREDNSCDICGTICTETLFEFRILEKKNKGQYIWRRMLCPYRASIAKECGRHLLGAPSEKTLFPRSIDGILNEDGPRKMFEDIVSHAERQRPSAHRREAEASRPAGQ